MGQALDRLRVLFARTLVARHQRVTAEGTIEDVEAHWRQLPASVRKTFKESMHAPTVQGGESHPFDAPDTRPLKDLAPGERAAFEAVQVQVGQRKAEALKAKVGADTRSAGYLQDRGQSARVQIRKTTYRGQAGFQIVGTDTKGRRVSIFEPDETKAKKIRDLIKAGDPDATQKVWGIGKYAR
jgi:hypothetical protein